MRSLSVESSSDSSPLSQSLARIWPFNRLLQLLRASCMQRVTIEPTEYSAKMLYGPSNGSSEINPPLVMLNLDLYRTVEGLL